jgi:GNAT superfamily N-acetyltransferase
MRESVMTDVCPTLLIRPAQRTDIAAIVMLYDEPDELSVGMAAKPDAASVYEPAFERVLADPSTTIFVAELDNQLIGTFQLTLTPGLALGGLVRATIEAVRIRADHRGRGYGRSLMIFAAREAKQRGAGAMQLTSNKQRHAAHRFYEGLGFARSHEGFKLDLIPRALIID